MEALRAAPGCRGGGGEFWGRVDIMVTQVTRLLLKMAFLIGIVSAFQYLDPI